jgi:hypothetical protein
MRECPVKARPMFEERDGLQGGFVRRRLPLD